MLNVTVYTKRYSLELSKFLVSNKVSYELFEASGFKAFVIPTATVYLKSFIQMLKCFVLDRNPIVKRSQRLKNILLQSVFTEPNNISEDLQNYISLNQTINMDGYVDFRLQDYTNKIDSILYAVVKKNMNTSLLLQEY